ncbi:flagellar basal body-associated FliL family protein [Pseudodesulfovibrio piezophilus]|uniref:Flagellar protein FliL n=1 Tax=Pseudodesulfovibrio piezophilus (strain DSM 21447 / JCM 15486 / C1TLV30) TaxID=1322246 RepID=M1WUI9_PSEP2|nr:flagellar basal body-associated FliL family protein [Pseudodesulfovibrio piezophilus]CCH47418.1 Flagellar basal body-associated protein FliL [Pseudodesulfovibrio piezophilus C1TLV30]
MVLLVPDDSEDLAEEVFGTSDDSGQPKAQLDDGEASKATQKVDLDLDDAPFLEDEEEEEDELAFSEEETPLLEEKKKSGFDFKSLLKNKMVLAFGGIILLLIVVIIILLFRSPEETESPPPPPPQVEEPVQQEIIPEEVVEETPEILIRLDPFLIEQRDKDNTIRFLEVRIVVSTLEDGLARQFKQETYTVRNALFYYLKNKDLQFLSDKNNSDKLKKELLAIINQYMGFGQFDTLLFEQYLVR